MAKQTVDELLGLAEHQFTLQAPMKSLWQVLAENFYPERADFTMTRNVGTEFADHLADSFPLLVRRDLGNSLTAMLRDGHWFNMTANVEPDYMGKVWLRERTEMLYKLFYHRSANFIRATKEGDHDFVTFGQSVKSVEVNRKTGGLMFRCWHLRDCAWFEDEYGDICGVIRKAEVTCRDMVNYFGENKVHRSVVESIRKEPFKKVTCYHLVLPSDMYRDDQIESRFPYVSLWVDADHKMLIEETGLNHKYYIVPRFQTIAGAPYAYSPATTVGLSDARCLQAMTHTLLEAAERFARPPLVATAKVVRGDVNLGADGITWVDEAYDERLGSSLRPLFSDKSGWPVGDAERERVVETLRSAFFTNKLTLPDTDREMTAFEVAERMKQFRRENLPLFAPIESEDNGQVCELAFIVAMQNNMLGSPYDIPRSLQGAEVQFKFESPLTATESEEMANRYQQVSAMLAEAVQLDPSIGHDIDLSRAIRDAVTGIGAPTSWLTAPEEADRARLTEAMMQMAQQEAMQ